MKKEIKIGEFTYRLPSGADRLITANMNKCLEELLLLQRCVTRDGRPLEIEKLSDPELELHLTAFRRLILAADKELISQNKSFFEALDKEVGPASQASQPQIKRQTQDPKIS